MNHHSKQIKKNFFLIITKHVNKNDLIQRAIDRTYPIFTVRWLAVHGLAQCNSSNDKPNLNYRATTQSNPNEQNAQGKSNRPDQPTKTKRSLRNQSSILSNKSFSSLTVMNSIEFPLLDRTTQNSVISTTLNDLSNWSRLSSLWPLLYGTSCCFIEFASLIGSRFDFDRYGLVPRSSPRQADLILTAGTVTMKMAPSLVRLYEQMPEPKYVIAMGACTITGGMFSTDSYSTVRGVDKLIPMDVYLPGCSSSHTLP
ncbi:hypothetical protein AHAS_Ahas19G0158300 [Arachis hypogaea]